MQKNILKNPNMSKNDNFRFRKYLKENEVSLFRECYTFFTIILTTVN